MDSFAGKVFIFARIRANASCNTLSLYIGDGGTVTTNKISKTTGLSDYSIFSGIFDITTAIDLSLLIYHAYADAATANGKTMEIDGVAGVHAINMTDVYYENYTEAKMLELVSNGYIDGLQGTNDKKITSVGKNLFDGKLVLGSYNPSTGEASVSTTTVRNSTKFIQVEAIEGYYIYNSVSTSGVRIFFYDSNKSFISYVDTQQFITPFNCRYINFRFISTDSTSNIQIEKGTTATAYEPFMSNSNYISNLYRIPNNVCDNVNAKTGKHTQNIKEYVLTEDDITQYNALTNILEIRIDKPDWYILDGLTGTGITGTILSEVKESDAVYATKNNVIYENTITAIGSASSLLLLLPLGTYTTLAEAKAALKDKVILYQLATPIITNVINTPLYTETAGTIQIENKFNAGWFHYTSDGIDLTNTGYDTQSISLATKATSEGQEILDVTDFVNTANVFTNSNLNDGDWVWLEVEHNKGTIPTLEYSAPMNTTGSLKTLNTKVASIDEDNKSQEKAIKQLQDSNYKKGNVEAGNYAEFNENGELRLYGEATQWDDLRFPALATKREGSKQPGIEKMFDNGSGSQGVLAYVFDKTAEEELYFMVQLPHNWKMGSDIEAHVHWLGQDNGGTGTDVCWALEYTWSNIGDVFGNTTIIHGDTNHEGEDIVADKHYLTELGVISATGKSFSSMMICRIFRDATNSQGTDDYDFDAALLEIDFHYQVDSLGSNEEYVKY
ncbi:hypothetical protein QUF55_07830 [Clostridiaceae bacterium HSG29]|nr:hypothetical protein [Clostridiaceae bacterium HSG29]